jgi:hypothetical protein
MVAEPVLIHRLSLEIEVDLGTALEIARQLLPAALSQQDLKSSWIGPKP